MDTVSPLREITSTELSLGPRARITAEATTMAATSTTMTARNAIRFPEACVIRNSPFLPLSCYGKGAMPPFFRTVFLIILEVCRKGKVKQNFPRFYSLAAACRFW